MSRWARSLTVGSRESPGGDGKRKAVRCKLIDQSRIIAG